MYIKSIPLDSQNITNGQNTKTSEPSKTKSAQESQSKQYIPLLDGIRAIACLAVITYHTNLVSTGFHLWTPLLNIHTLTGTLAFFTASTIWFGELGVVLFFVLSGLLLFLPFAKALLFDSSWPSLRRFYIRRSFRIIPGYYTVLFLIALFFHQEFLLPVNWHYLWIFLTFRMNFALSQHLDGPFWTLAIEFQFYLLLPILAWLFSLIVRRGTACWRLFKLTFCLFLMIAWGLLTRYWGSNIANTSKLDFLIPHHLSIKLIPYLYSDTGTYSEAFAIGMLAAMIYTYAQYAASTEVWRIRMRRLSPLILTVGLILFSFMNFWHFYFFDIAPRHFAKFPSSYVVFTFLDHNIIQIVTGQWGEWQALGYALSYGLCILALLHSPAKLKRPFESSPLRWVASISFSLYMWHIPFMDLFEGAIGPQIQHQHWSPIAEYLALWCWTLIIIVPSATTLYRWIELPGIRLGEWLIHKLERLRRDQY